MSPTQEVRHKTSTTSCGSGSNKVLVLCNCPAKATDIELKFESMTDKEFLIQVEASNGEKSQMLHFLGAGKTHQYTPTKSGCGHGNWNIEVFERDEDGNWSLKLTEELLADGTGSLSFTVGDNLQPALVSQVWKHLRKNSTCRKYSFYGGEK